MTLVVNGPQHPIGRDAPALAEFPQLGRLVELCAAGWLFLRVRDGAGELTELRGVRLWPGGYADALRLRYVTDATAVRCDHTGGVLWQRSGTLVDVCDGLLSLPAPDRPGAARMVTATVPRGGRYDR